MERKLFAGNPNEHKTIVTPRGFEEVREDLFLSLDSLTPGETVVSIGEGLSDFGQTVQHMTGCRVLAVDPIYAVIHPQDTLDVAYAKIQAAGAGGPSTIPKTIAAPLPPGKVPTAIAGSVYDLSFIEDASVGSVVSNRVLEHIDIAKAAPEMVRIIKDTGEVRIGSPMVIYMHQGTPSLFLGRLERDEYGCEEAIPYGDETAFYRYLALHPELQVYVFSTGHTRQQGSRLIGNLLVIRRDERLPVIASPSIDFSDQAARRSPDQVAPKLFKLSIHHPEKPFPDARLTEMAPSKNRVDG